jgi:NAD(P)-dependent dehydrogenase (short-subunit alcohol dehydrogenase family)
MTTNNGQRVLVTAGAGGIGRATATAFAAAGARVHVCDIDTAALNALSAQVPGITTSVCDVADRDAMQGMVHDVIATLGGLDVLVNNAGISGPTASVEDMDPAAWEAVLRVNLTGTFIVTQAAIPHLKHSAAGSIVVMSSLAGRFGYPNRSPYSTTKWGLIGFTRPCRASSVNSAFASTRSCPAPWTARAYSRSSKGAPRLAGAASLRSKRQP